MSSSANNSIRTTMPLTVAAEQQNEKEKEVPEVVSEVDVDLLDRLEILFQQEHNYYNVCSLPMTAEDEPMLSHYHSWREKMCDWSYQVVDHLDFCREIVSIGMNCFDRFIVANAIHKEMEMTKTKFQLYAMTCIYLAVKLNQNLCNHTRLSIHYMTALSQDCFTAKDIESAEVYILKTLNWHIHPTTPLVFLRHYVQLALLPPKSQLLAHNIVESGQFFIELATLDSFFLSYPSSTIAMAAFFHSIEHLPVHTYNKVVSLWQTLHAMDANRCPTIDIMHCRERFLKLHTSNQETSTTTTTTTNEDESPVSPNHNSIQNKRIKSPTSVSDDSLYYCS